MNELFKAMCNVQSELKGAIKDSENPFFKSKYADLQSIWDSCREPLTRNGLTVIQTTEESDKGSLLITTLGHISGQFIEGRLKLMPKDNSPQALGSAISYARRYALAAIVGVYQKDDDAETAMSRDVPPPYPNTQRMDAESPFDFSQSNPKLSNDGTKTCDTCGTLLKVSKRGDMFYCPNFKDLSKGEHQYARI